MSYLYLFFILSNLIHNVNTNFNFELGYKTANLASIAYCDNLKIINWDCKRCIENFPNFEVIDIIWNEKTSFFGFYGFNHDDNTFYLSIEGTQDFTDFLYDISIIKIDKFNGKIHSGFWKAYNSVKPEIKKIINLHNKIKSNYKSNNIYITGHSLGASMATLTIIDFKINENITFSGMYNFGSPRVGDKDFSIFFNDNIQNYYRITHRKDPVIHLPLLIMDYYHIPNEIFYDTNEIIYCSDAENKSCADKYLFSGNIEDHRNYMNIPNFSTCY